MLSTRNDDFINVCHNTRIIGSLTYIKEAILLIKQQESSESINLQQLGISLKEWISIVENKYSQNSQSSLNSDLMKFFKECSLFGFNPLLISQDQFLSVLSTSLKKDKPSTIRRYTSSISVFFDGLNLQNHLKSKYVKSFITKANRNKGVSQKQAAPLKIEHLDKLYEILSNSNDLGDLRDLLVLSFMFECMMRRNEIIMIKIENLDLNGDFPLLEIPKSKTDQEGEGAFVPFSTRTKSLIEKFLAISDLNQGYLIRPLSKSRNIKQTDKPIGITSINNIAARASELLELENKLSGHSGRVGAIQELVNDGCNPTAIQHNARLKSTKMVGTYSRKISAADLPMRHFLKNR